MDTIPNSDAMPNPTVPDPVVATLRLPEFWQADSQLWFLSVSRVTFPTTQVASQTARYDYVISALPPAVIAIVTDILRSRPPDNTYDTLKEELIRWTTESKQRGLQQLLTLQELGNQTPTESLHRMRHLIGDHSAALNASILR
ncbi:uncharacterized protein LOC142790639 [Rhipicephalus microplus]|uniref:uncharacterized protein LOC142790639 n=1 Tax=Rhipicephalus microplus TaxID=6941 RepID=UPI003F6D7928